MNVVQQLFSICIIQSQGRHTALCSGLWPCLHTKAVNVGSPTKGRKIPCNCNIAVHDNVTPDSIANNNFTGKSSVRRNNNGPSGEAPLRRRWMGSVKVSHLKLLSRSWCSATQLEHKQLSSHRDPALWIQANLNLTCERSSCQQQPVTHYHCLWDLVAQWQQKV